MNGIFLDESDILDVTQGGRWVLLRATDNTKRIGSGSQVHFRGITARVDSAVLGSREERLALTVTHTGDANATH